MHRFFLIGLGLVPILAGQPLADLDDYITQQLLRNEHTVPLRAGAKQSIQMELQPGINFGARIDLGLEDPAAIHVSLRLPDGRIADEKAAAMGAKWERDSAYSVWVHGLCKSAKEWIFITLPPGARTGRYTVEVTATSKTSVCSTYASTGLFLPKTPDDSGMEFAGELAKTDRERYRPGDAVTISVPVMAEGVPVQNAQVEAVVILKGDEKQATPVLLSFDKKSGNYTGVFRPAIPGVYYMEITIGGRNRHERRSFAVDPLAAELQSATWSLTEGHLILKMHFRVFVSGEYIISPLFQSSNQHMFNMDVVKQLAPGEQNVIWDFPPEGFLEATPPYTPVEIHVARTNPSAEFGRDIVSWWVYDSGKWRAR